MTLNFMEIPNQAHPNNSVPRDGWDRPLIVPKAGGKPVGHTRTTTFIDCIEDKSNLTTWGKRMTLVGAAKQPSLLDAVSGLDPNDKDDKKKLDALAERAVDVSGANDKREKGTHLHTLSEFVDAGKPLPFGTPQKDVEDMMAYMLATSVLKVHAVEQFVVVNELNVGGTFDRTYEYDGPGPDGKPISGLFIGDLKTGSVEYGALKMASQLAIYSRGEKYDHTHFPVDHQDKKALAAWKKVAVDAEQAEKAYSPLPPVNQDWGIIVHLPAGTGECTLYWVDLNIGWALAQLALQIRKARSTRGAMKPFVTQVTENELASSAASV
ncbi:exonuclease [Streptomyces phage Vanseggelen]|uniref:Exonuclease n=1 Tax=Streptomyces phage Vanseggelen TaxID=3065246 RepID=A0AA50ICV0_9CAUD|nr:exonuclease [Streptomyces phage Vanseggelen]